MSDDLSYVNPSTANERWRRSRQLWERYLAAGGSLAPQYDPRDPMHKTYLAEGIYELGSIPSDLVREELDFEALIAATLRCDSLEAAQLEIENFRRNLPPTI